MFTKSIFRLDSVESDTLRLFSKHHEKKRVRFFDYLVRQNPATLADTTNKNNGPLGDKDLIERDDDEDNHSFFILILLIRGGRASPPDRVHRPLNPSSGPRKFWQKSAQSHSFVLSVIIYRCCYYFYYCCYCLDPAHLLTHSLTRIHLSQGS